MGILNSIENETLQCQFLPVEKRLEKKCLVYSTGGFSFLIRIFLNIRSVIQKSEQKNLDQLTKSAAHVVLVAVRVVG